MNKLYRDRIIRRIASAVSEAKSAIEIGHPGLAGQIREVLVKQLLEPLLSSQFSLGTGKIMDLNGKESKQVDIIVYSPHVMAPFFYSSKGDIGIFPVDCTLATVEVKTKLNAKRLLEAIENAGSCSSESFAHIPGFMDQEGKPLNSYFMSIFRTLFAFDSDLSEKDEFERYKEMDSDWSSNPKIEAFCIVGKGFWVFIRFGVKRGWYKVEPDGEYNEVIAFLRLLIETSQLSGQRRGLPSLGFYLIENDSFNLIKA